MFKNYIKIAVRNLIKSKIYTLITIFGMAIGIAYCLLTFLYIRNEWTYDNFHQNSNHIFRIYKEYSYTHTSAISADAAHALGPVLKQTFPEVTDFVRLCGGRGREWEDRMTRFRYKDQSFDEKLLLVDPSFFDVFTFPLKEGNPETVFEKLKSIVISEQAAHKYFGHEDPMGKFLSIRSIWNNGLTEDFLVTGIIKNIPENSSIKFDFLIPYENLFFFFYDKPDWQHSDCNTYITLAPGTSVEQFENKLTIIVNKYIMRPGTYFKTYKLKLQPISNLHLNTKIENRVLHGLESPSDPLYSYVLTVLSLIILIVACINFVHLALGRSFTRFKEIGIRKVYGAKRRNIIKQFLGESTILAFISIGFGLVFAELFLPVFNSFINKSLNFYLFDVSNIAALFTLVIIIGILAGAYPAIILSGFQPVKIFRNTLKVGGENRFSRILIILQFSFSTLLIIATLIMFRQLQFVRSSKTLGFNKENLVVIRTDLFPEYRDMQGILANKLKQHSQITDVSTTRYNYTFWQGPSLITHADGSEMRVRKFYVDFNFIKTVQLLLLGGRDFDRENDSQNSGSMIVNESFVQQMKWDNPIGQLFQFDRKNNLGFRKTDGQAKVIGLVKDFHLLSFYEESFPAALILNPGIGQESKLCIARIKPENIPETIAYMEKVFKELTPQYSFRYSFLDNDIENFYRDEKHWANLISYSAIFAIFIACLGVLGLITLIITHRTKEIGIRKVFGASVSTILIMLSKEFIKWVIVASIISGPIAYYVMNKWLQNFAYRIDISWWVFALAGGLALAITLLTVSTQAIKAALANPVESLRYE